MLPVIFFFMTTLPQMSLLVSCFTVQIQSVIYLIVHGAVGDLPFGT
jgi:hypothetical protein